MNRIEINGQEYPVRMTFRILTHFGKKYKKSRIADLQEALNVEMEDVPDLMLRCVKAGCKYEGEDCTLTRENVMDALDEDFTLMERFMNMMASDLTGGNRQNNQTPEAAGSGN